MMLAKYAFNWLPRTVNTKDSRPIFRLDEKFYTGSVIIPVSSSEDLVKSEHFNVRIEKPKVPPVNGGPQ